MREEPSRRQQMMTRHSPGLFGAAVLLLAITSPALADVEQGRIIAERWCAACHLVGPGQVTRERSGHHVRRSRETRGPHHGKPAPLPAKCRIRRCQTCNCRIAISGR